MPAVVKAIRARSLNQKQVRIVEFGEHLRDNAENLPEGSRLGDFGLGLFELRLQVDAPEPRVVIVLFQILLDRVEHDLAATDLRVTDRLGLQLAESGEQ